jgi:hypothetical protein
MLRNHDLIVRPISLRTLSSVAGSGVFVCV